MTDTKGTLARIDPATNRVVAEISVAPGSFGIAFGEGAVWVTSSEKNVVTRVNAFTNVVEHAIPVGPTPRFLAVGEGAVWTLNQGDGSISRVDVADATRWSRPSRPVSPGVAARSRLARDRSG